MAEFEAFVAFHSKFNTAAEIRPNIAGIPGTIGELSRHGVGAVFVPGNSYNWYGGMSGESSAHVYGYQRTGSLDLPLSLDETGVEMPFGAGGITAVRSRVATPELMQGLVPIVNDRSVRAVGADKALQVELFGGRMAPTTIVRPGETVSDMHLDSLAGEAIAIKAANGKAGSDSFIGVGREDAARVVADIRTSLGVKAAKTSILLQEMSRGVPFAGLGDPYDNHEIRVNCFATNVDGNLVLRPDAVYREGAGEEDRWHRLWQDHLGLAPYFRTAEAVAMTLFERTGARGALLAVDMYQTEPDGPVLLREVNTRDPDFGAMLELGRQQATLHSTLLGQQLATLALAPQPMQPGVR